MTTVLEYILIQYLGKPTRTRGNGESEWSCPQCGAARFHTLPIKPPFKHRAKCWNSDCDFRGDAADMLKEFHPDENYGDRILRLEQFEREWESLNRKKNTSPSGGDRGVPAKPKNRKQ
jgi:hypothetical protein